MALQVAGWLASAQELISRLRPSAAGDANAGSAGHAIAVSFDSAAFRLHTIHRTGLRDLRAEIAWADVSRVVAFRSLNAQQRRRGGTQTLAIASAGNVRTDINERMLGWSDFVAAANTRLHNCPPLQDWLDILDLGAPAIIFDLQLAHDKEHCSR